MDWSLISPVRYFINTIRGERTRRQLAMGFALGLVIGLLPKGNLTAVAVTSVLFASRVNIGMGLLTATLVSLISPSLDPLFDTVGRGILMHDAWQDTFARWYQLPLVPWLGLHNTVVLGSLIFGSVIFLPAYFASQPLFAMFEKQEAGKDRTTLQVQREAPRVQPGAPHLKQGLPPVQAKEKVA